MIPNSILEAYGLEGQTKNLGGGRINDTYLVDSQYVLQRINSRVFVDPKSVIENFRTVEPYVFDLVPRLVQTKDGKDWAEDEEGGVWRATVYFEGRNFQALPSSLFFAAGEAYGLFLSRTKKIDCDLNVAIEGFHDIVYVWKRLQTDKESSKFFDQTGYVDSILEEFPDFKAVQQVIHADTRVNNLIFHPSKSRVLRIVDLDTLMVGHPALDFGDLVRSAMTGLDADHWREDVVASRLSDLCNGFFSMFPLESGDNLEIYSKAPSHMCIILGMRFLLDHAKGDKYFKVNERGDNLVRTRRQMEYAHRFQTIQKDLLATIEDVHSQLGPG